MGEQLGRRNKNAEVRNASQSAHHTRSPGASALSVPSGVGGPAVCVVSGASTSCARPQLRRVSRAEQRSSRTVTVSILAKVSSAYEDLYLD